MAMTHDYLDYLEDQIGISPANSQEELQAAQTIADLMKKHDVDVNVEEFDAPGSGRFVRCVLLVLMFVGVILSGTGISVLGIVLALVPGVLLILDVLGVGGDFLSKLGPAARSQNVVAVHHATGELVAKGNRPIVVVAHYDSPHDSFLYGSPLSRYIPMLRKALKWLVPAVTLCALLQAFSFLPAPLRSVLWVAGILLAIPLVAFGADGIYQRFSTCSLGSNDNKSSVAALLGILENVRPSGEKPVSQRAIEREQHEKEAAQAQAEAEQAAAAAQAPVPAPAPAPQAEEIVGVSVSKFTKRFPAIHVSIEVPDEVLMVPMDATLIRQVIMNLLENAAIHGGNVTQIRVCLSREGTNACFAISDNGVGIPKERLSTIFNGGLSGVSHNNFDMKKNMGIGLSVCYTIVKAHDGTMTAENLDSGGACFRFYLPLEEGINSEIEG